MTVDERVSELRRLMKQAGLDAWYINGTDPHGSEYVAPRWRTRAFISGFTGSAGTVIVTKDEALIWVDSRYFVQCRAQIEGTCFQMRCIDGPDATNPLDSIKGRKTGIAAETLSLTDKRKFNDKNVELVPMDDLLDYFWTDRPAMPAFPVEQVDEKLFGATVKEKLDRIRAKGNENGESWHIVSSLDDIAWTLNLRGKDIDDTPVFLSHLLIGPDSCTLFTPLERFDGTPHPDYEVLPYDAVSEKLSQLRDTTIRLNPASVNMLLVNSIDPSVRISEGLDHSTNFKACKNDCEMDGMREAHILDGVALVNFLALVERNQYDFTEISIAKALEDERSCEEEYLGPSFSTIAGFADHGAVVHYSATPETDKAIEGSGLLVLDSGGQYSCGTTDVTRTLLFGEATQEQKDDYTLVLKGHLSLANQIFPKGTSGHQLDILAHQYLWQNGMTYFHGTGHGVGCRLSVHEGPQRISTHKASAEVALEPGMVISDEPGLYKAGKHGIRIENLVAVVPAFENEFGTFYTFETLTCCPYERKLINKGLLSKDEINMVDAYHAWVWDMLHDMVDPEAVKYLRKATRPL